MSLAEERHFTTVGKLCLKGQMSRADLCPVFSTCGMGVRTRVTAQDALRTTDPAWYRSSGCSPSAPSSPCPRTYVLAHTSRVSPKSDGARLQLAVVYLGVALAKTDEKGSSKAVEYTVIAISFAFSGLAAYYIYWYMNKSRLVVWRLHRYVLQADVGTKRR